METSTDLHRGSWSSMELRGGLHGVPDNVGRRRTATVFYVFSSELLIVDFQGTFGGIYTTACSSDVCNIPTHGHCFCIFKVSA